MKRPRTGDNSTEELFDYLSTTHYSEWYDKIEPHFIRSINSEGNTIFHHFAATVFHSGYSNLQVLDRLSQTTYFDWNSIRNKDGLTAAYLAVKCKNKDFLLFIHTKFYSYPVLEDAPFRPSFLATYLLWEDIPMDQEFLLWGTDTFDQNMHVPLTSNLMQQCTQNIRRFDRLLAYLFAHDRFHFLHTTHKDLAGLDFPCFEALADIVYIAKRWPSFQWDSITEKLCTPKTEFARSFVLLSRRKGNLPETHILFRDAITKRCISTCQLLGRTHPKPFFVSALPRLYQDSHPEFAAWLSHYRRWKPIREVTKWFPPEFQREAFQLLLVYHRLGFAHRKEEARILVRTLADLHAQDMDVLLESLHKG